MAYYSGQAASYQELLNVLVDACVDQGWTWADGILSKGKIYIRFEVNTNPNADFGEGLIAQLGIGQTRTNLLTPSNTRVRLGKVSSDSWGADFTFPVSYNIHIFDNNNEVFFVVKTGVDKYLYLTFGQSEVSGYGAWISASTGVRFSPFTSNVITLYPDFSGDAWHYSKIHAPFWVIPSGGYDSNLSANEICRDEVNNNWLNDQTSMGIGLTAFLSYKDLITRQPSVWSSETVLLPINIYASKSQSKISHAFTIQNARYLRIDNYEQEQIIALGNLRWKIYPFYKKNIAVRNSGLRESHSGTFGWAIRYDGP
ncbi:hypothetical protein [Acinetobacter ursingii]|uniref:hypothetical protein n=1 Tax=Acinetobacter ursingii TaxID=108980 RepID=UPI0040346247